MDIEAATFADEFNPFSQPHFILLNLAIGSNGADPGNAEFPVFHEVDYVRIYQEIAGGSN